jgi:hypothetical protein
MRILVIRKPTSVEADGFDLARFKVGHQYDVGTQLGSYMVAERWADFVDSSGQRFSSVKSDRRHGADRRREAFPHHPERRHAADRRLRERRMSRLNAKRKS